MPFFKLGIASAILDWILEDEEHEQIAITIAGTVVCVVILILGVN